MEDRPVIEYQGMQSRTHYGSFVTHQLISKYARRAEEALQVLGRLGPRGKSDYVVQNIARMLFGEIPEPKDDADIAAAPSVVNRLIELFLDIKLGDTAKREQLVEIIRSAEIILGVATGSADGPAVYLNQPLSNMRERRPDMVIHAADVPAELRDLVTKYWEERQTLAALDQPEPRRTPAATKALVKAAEFMVDSEIVQGAFIKPYKEMGHGQQRFWRQRAAGVVHPDKPPKIDMRALWQSHEAQQKHLASLAKRKPRKTNARREALEDRGILGPLDPNLVGEVIDTMLKSRVKKDRGVIIERGRKHGPTKKTPKRVRRKAA